MGIAKSRPTRTEGLVLFALILVFYLASVFSYNLFPTVWADEVLWADPAINLVETGQFTTSVWQLQPAGTFWAAHSPLYCFVLSVWMHLAGTTLLAARSLNFLLISGVVAAVWMASWKYGLVKQPVLRLLIAPLVLMDYGMSFSYRCIRPDVLGWLALLGLLFAFSIRPVRARQATVFVAAALTSWVGFQVGFYAVLACVLARLALSRITWRDVVLVCIGVGAGALSLFAFYAAHDSLGYFFATLLQAKDEHVYWGRTTGFLSSVPRRLLHTAVSYLSDFSVVPLIAALVYCCVFFRRRFNQNMRRTIRYLVLLYLLIPLAFNFTGHFAFYYSGMIALPILFASLMAFSAFFAEPVRNRILSWSVVACAYAVAISVGVPLRLALSLSFFHAVPRTESAAVIRKTVKPDDVVFADYLAYFEVKQVAQLVYSPMYAKAFADLSAGSHEFSDREREGVTVLIINPERLKFVGNYFGGRWVPVSPEFGDAHLPNDPLRVPGVGGWIARHLTIPQMSRYRLQVFRRASTDDPRDSLQTER